MKYIRIKNNGVIEPEALHLVGASTKRNDSSKIGQFGSGNKYAIAYLLRSGYDIKVFAGTQEIKIGTEKKVFRDNEFNVITINGVATSITDEMGKDWKFWQAMRELYCNALDEGGCSLDFVYEIEPKENETHFYIDNRGDVPAFVGNFDNYFATKKKVLFECPTGRILEKSGTVSNIYRKGIRCFNANKTSVFDYDFFEMGIDENRLVKYYWEVEEKIWSLIYQCDNEELIMQCLHSCHNTEFLEGCISDISSISTAKMSETFKNCITKLNLAPKGMAGLLKPDEVENHIIVPSKIFNSFRGVLKDENVGDRFKVSRRGGIFREIETTPLYEATIKQALYFFKEVQFDIPYEITVAMFENKDILGLAWDGKIILSDVCLERGTNEIVNCIIEEFIHLKYGVADETRNFQDKVICEFISYMKKSFSFAI